MCFIDADKNTEPFKTLIIRFLGRQCINKRRFVIVIVADHETWLRPFTSCINSIGLDINNLTLVNYISCVHLFVTARQMHLSSALLFGERDCFTASRIVCHVAMLLLFLMAGNQTADGKSLNNRQVGNKEKRKIGCQPVKHDSLWIRLDMEPNFAESPHFKGLEGQGARRKVRHAESKIRHELQRYELPAANRSATEVVEISTLDRQPEAAIDENDSSGVSSKSRGSDVVASRKQLRALKKLHSRGFKKESWHCTMETQWKKMKEGTFPPYVQTGNANLRNALKDCTSARPRSTSSRF